MKLGVETCLSPELIHQFDLKGKAVVIIDVLRATTCMVAAFINRADHLRAFEDVDECRKMRAEGYLLAGERNGEKIEDFDLGNSPREYLNMDLNGKTVAITTTNGTRAIHSSKESSIRLIGAFTNKRAVANKIRALGLPVVFYCAGWKGKVNLEDTLLSGALIEELGGDFENLDDSSFLAYSVFKENRENYLEFLRDASHVKRLGKLHQGNDLEYCVSENLTEMVPFVEGDRILV